MKLLHDLLLAGQNTINAYDTLSQYSLLHLYAPIIDNVGFSHPLIFTIITLHNTFSFSHLLFAVAIAYPAFHEKTWLISAAITVVWTMISISLIATLDIFVTTVIA